jgi:hypothetical protein
MINTKQKLNYPNVAIRKHDLQSNCYKSVYLNVNIVINSKNFGKSWQRNVDP